MPERRQDLGTKPCRKPTFQYLIALTFFLMGLGASWGPLTNMVLHLVQAVPLSDAEMMIVAGLFMIGGFVRLRWLAWKGRAYEYTANPDGTHGRPPQ